MIQTGVARKSPAWRFGSWLLGTGLLVAIPLWSGMMTLAWSFIAAIAGTALTAPWAFSRMRGGGPYVPDPMPIRVREVGALTYVLFLFFYRLPVAFGDQLYTWFWNAVSRIHRRRDERVTLTTSPAEEMTRTAVDYDSLWWSRDE